MSQIKTKYIADNQVTNAKLAQVSSQTIKGRTTAGTGNSEDLTATQATAILNNFVGDSGSGGTKGLVVAPSTGDATKFLRGDATWATPSGGGGGSNVQYNIIIGSAAQVTAGTATNSTFASVTQADGDRVLLLPTYVTTENWSVTKILFIEGMGSRSVITGTVTFSSATSESQLTNVRVTDNITLNSGANSIHINNIILASGKTFIDNGTGNLLEGIQE